MVGEILYFLHRHVRVATPVAVVLFAAAAVGMTSLVSHLVSSLAR